MQINYPSKTYTLNFNANSQGATIKDQSGNTISNISFDVAFSGWTSNNLGSNALRIIFGIPPTNNIIESWNGDLTKYQNYENLRESGTVTMEANWMLNSFELPSITKAGYLCGYSTTASGNIEYYAGDTFTTSSDTGTSDTLYAKCVQYNYTIAYYMQGGTLPTLHPEGGFTDQDVIISNPSTKTVTISFINPDGALIHNDPATPITSMTSNQTFKGWTAASSGNYSINTSTAKTRSSSGSYASWNGSETKNTYFKNLRSSGEVRLIANWNSSSITLPYADISGRNCFYATGSSDYVSYSPRDTYSVTTTSNTDSLYVRCLMAENLGYNTTNTPPSNSSGSNETMLYNSFIYTSSDEDAQHILDVIADILK